MWDLRLYVTERRLKGAFEKQGSPTTNLGEFDTM